MRFGVVLFALICAVHGFAVADEANAAIRKPINIPAQGLQPALHVFAKEKGIQVVYKTAVVGELRTLGAAGDLTADEALKRLLSGTGLTFRYLDERTVTIVPVGAKTPAAGAASNPDNPYTGSGSRLAQVEDQGMKKVEISPTSPSATSNVQRDSETSSGASGSKDSTTSEDTTVTVTGSRISNVPSSQLAANVITLTADDLRATGRSTLEGALRELPQNTFGATEIGAAIPGGGMAFNGAINVTGGSSVNLRGLGGESTLILIDGQRIGKSGLFGGISDISGIPLSSVERVDIVLDGASSIYGSDAIGGVVNIILKKDYRGLETMADYGRPEHSGLDESTLTLSGGSAWRSGRGRLTAERFNRSNLDGGERPERITYSVYQQPGTVTGSPLFYTYNGQRYTSAQLAAAGLTRTSPGVQAVSFTVIPSELSGSILTIADLIPFASTRDRRLSDPDGKRGYSLIPAQTRNTIQGGIDQSIKLLGQDISISANGYYSDRTTKVDAGPFGFAASLPATNPANPFGVRTNLNWKVGSLPSKSYETNQDVARANISISGDIQKKWRWALSGNTAVDKINTLYVNEAIDVADVTSLIADGLNVFTSDIEAENTPELLARLVSEPYNIRGKNEESTIGFDVNGSLLSLPSGAVRAAFGADWRKEELESSTETTLINPGLITSGSIPGGAYTASRARTQRSVFAEVMAPLFGENVQAPLAKKLILIGSGRKDFYDQYDNATTWSAGAVWNPFNGITVRANKNTSYVVPTFKEGLIPSETYDAVADCGLPGCPMELVGATGAPTGNFDYYSKILYSGNPDLMPETASSRTIGLQVNSPRFPRVSFGATWHETKYNNRIAAAPQVTWFDGIDLVAAYPNLSRDENGGLVWDLRAINMAFVEESGIDYQMRYSATTAFGEFNANMNVQYVDKYRTVPFRGQEPINGVANVGFLSQSVIPRYRYAASIGTTRGGFSVNIDASTSSKTEVATLEVLYTTSFPVIMDAVFSYDFDSGSMNTTDVKWLQGVAVSLRALNILNDRPEWTTRRIAENGPELDFFFNANASDPIGRMFYVNVTKHFGQ